MIDHGGTRLAVLTVAYRKGGVRMKTVDTKGRLAQLGAADFDDQPEAVGRIELPVPFAPKDPVFRHEVGDALRAGARSRGARGVMRLAVA